jgi:hypothetical protein
MKKLLELLVISILILNGLGTVAGSVSYEKINEPNIEKSYTSSESLVIFNESYDFLIIAPEQFQTALQKLVDHKNNLDPPVKTILTNLEDIPDYPEGVDEQEDIKYYIKESIETWGIKYVLLVGAGVEGKELFPVRYAWIGTLPFEEKFPCDLYYADIYDIEGNFSSWDYDEDGKYAEFPDDLAAMDFIPDVYLGKLPCNNVCEVKTVVDKIIRYKEHNKITKKILLIGSDTNPGDPIGVYEGEILNEKVLEKLPGYSPIRLWGSNITKKNIRNGFHKSVDFVHFSGYGNYKIWATHPHDDMYTWIPPKTLISPSYGFLYYDFDRYRFNNIAKLPVVVYDGSNINRYTEFEECLGWKTVSRSGGGGIATFAPTGVCFVTDLWPRLRYMAWMTIYIFEEMYNNKILGKAWANCIMEYYYNFETVLDNRDCKTMCEFSLFGDPTLAIEDGENPQVRPVNKPLLPTLIERLIYYFPQFTKLIEQIIVKLS